MAGIMHFTEYYKLMEECEHAYLQKNGIEIIGTYIWPRISCSAEFFKPVKFGDTLLIGIDGVNIGRTSINYSFVIQNKDDDHIVTMGTIKTVCCVIRDDGSIKSNPLPDDIREVLSELVVETD